MCLLMIPASWAATATVNNVISWDKQSHTVSNVVVISSDMASNDLSSDVTGNTGGWYVVSGDITVSTAIKISGDVHLILSGDSKLNAPKGITVASGDSLTIYATSPDSTGKLVASGDEGSAGIGGSAASADAGTITIVGGTIVATGGSGTPNYGAGIGGGQNGAGGIITIYGGTVSADGGYAAAGIGGGGKNSTGSNNRDGGKITIKGGTVKASSKSGAGIGGGGYGGTAGTILISGGTVTATGKNGAAIGSGLNPASGGSITISGGKVTTKQTSGGSAYVSISADKVSLGWSEDKDFINATSYGGTVTITRGFVFSDDKRTAANDTNLNTKKSALKPSVDVLKLSFDLSSDPSLDKKLVITPFPWGLAGAKFSIEWPGYNCDSYTLSQNGGGDTSSYSGHTFNMPSATEDEAIIVIKAALSLLRYPISYDLKVGTHSADINSNDNPTSYTSESEDILITSPDLKGYEFLGWSGDTVESLDEGTSLDVVIPAGSVGSRDYTAHWRIITYTISYDLDGGTKSGDIPTSYDVDSPDIHIYAPTKAGHQFTGWTLSEDSTVSLDVTIPSGSIGNRHYKAGWKSLAAFGYTDSYTPNGKTNPYIITSDDGWRLLNEALGDTGTWNNFAGKIVQLSGDIGKAESPITIILSGDFSGTFDGQGHTLYVSYDASADYTAPFRSTSGTATIKNLNVSGIIRASKPYAAGLIGRSDGTTTIENCSVDVTISSDYTGDAYHGGFVAYQTAGTLSIDKSAFTGSLLGAKTNSVGGFVGRKSGTITITNSFFDPDKITVNVNESSRFVRGSVNITNGYYTGSPDISSYNQGKQGYVVSADQSKPAALSGDTVITVSLDASSENGLVYQEKIYAGKSDTLTIGISGGSTPKPGYKFNRYTASAGTLTSADNEGKYTLTLPADLSKDVILSADFSKIVYSISYDININTHSSDITNNNPTSYDVETAITVTSPDLDGYEFKSWTYSSDTASGATTVSGVVTFSAGTTGNMRFRANWEIIPYTISYDLGITGASNNNNPKTYNIDSGEITIADPSCDGQVFTGWTVSKDGAVSPDKIHNPTIPANSSGDLYFTANWKSLTAFGYTTGYTPDGTSGKPYVIVSADGWELLNDVIVDEGTWHNFSGKIIKLSADIGSEQDPITTIISGDFRGTLDGQGHTLYISYNATEASGDYSAPFSVISGDAVIKNLTVEGTIKTNAKYTAGIVGKSYGNITIENCRVGVTINSSVDGAGYHGGFVGQQSGGTLSLSSDVFYGSLLGGATHSSGGFVGDNAGTTTIKDSLFAPAKVSMNSYNSATFSRGTGTATFTNIYYTQAFGTEQGKQGYIVSGDASVPEGLSVDAGITVSLDAANVSGLSYDKKIYVGANDTVTLEISGGNTPMTGYKFTGYTVSTGTLTSNDSKYTLTIDATLAGNVIVSAGFSKDVYTISYNLDGGISGDKLNPTSYDVTTLSIKLTNPTKTGYTFTGWTGTAITSASTDVTIPNGSTGNRNYKASWDIITYAISYDLDGGTVATPNPTTYMVTSDAITLTAPTKTGYTFTGWTGTGLSSASTDVTIPAGSTGSRDYTATWQAHTYSVVFDSNKGTGSMRDMSLTYDAASQDLTANSYTRSGYDFMGWNTQNDGNGTDYTNGQKVQNLTSADKGVVTLYAKWKSIMYTISYTVSSDATGAENNPKSYTVESADIKLDNPTKTGYTFEGWTLSDDNTKQTTVTITKGSTGNRSYTAHFRANTYTVVFNANGGTGTMSNQTFTYNTAQALTDNNFTRTGYSFDKWSDDKGSNYSDKQSVNNLTSEDKGVVTLYAQWNINKYTITYSGDVTGSTNPTSYDVNTATITLTNPTKTGYTFTGWTGSNDVSTSKDVRIEKGSTGNRSYTANWKLITYTISYDLAGGTVSANPTTYTVESDNITLTNPTKTGYTFAGWVSGDSVSATATVTIATGSTGDRKYSATWTAHTYTVIFNSNGGSDAITGTMSFQILSYDVSQDLTPNAYTRTGYSFTAWNTQADGSGTSYEDKQKVVNLTSADKANVNLYAQWNIIVYSIDYTGLEGAASPDNPTSYDVTTATFTLKSPDKAGYTFTGWTGSNDATTPQTTVTIAKGSTGNRTYNANWGTVSYTITYNLNGGVSGDTPNPTSYDVTTATFTLNNPTRAGYTFKGWEGTSIDAGLSTDVTIPTGSTGNRNYTASWDIVVYTISYDLAGGTVSEDNPESYTVDSHDFKLANPIRTGYDFVGWTGTSLDAATETVTIAQGSTGHRSYVASWDIHAFTITYAGVEGAAFEADNPTTYTLNSGAITLNNPTKDGFTFTGWTGTSIDVATHTVTIPAGSSGDRTYTAHWEDLAAFGYSDGYVPDGSQEKPYIISGSDGWELLARAIGDTATWNSFSGKFLRLSADIGTETSPVTTILSGDFSGTFDGQGHTLTVSFDSSTEYTAPFRSTSSTATIKNFNVAGTIRTSAPHAAGLIGQSKGTTTIENCNVSATIDSSVDGEGSHGGFVAEQSASTTLTVEGCVFSGKILGEKTDTWGGFVGDRGNRTTTKITDSLFAPAEITSNPDFSYSFSYGGGTITNSYYTMAFDNENYTSQGKQGFTVSADTGITVALADESTKGLAHDGTVYAGASDILILTITGGITSETGYGASNYSADVGILMSTESADTYTLEMPSNPSNVTISAVFTAETYTISYDLASGDLPDGQTNPTSYDVNTETFTLNNPVRTGYDFAGWTGTSLDAAVATVTIAKGSTGNRDYKATWQVVSYPISYDLGSNDVTDPGNPASYTVETATFKLTNPTRTGYNFAGWTGTGLTSVSTDVTIPAGSTGSRDYTATWTANTYTVTFDANNGTGYTRSQGLSYDVATALLTNTYTPITGYEFAGWNTKKDGSGSSYTDGEEVSGLTSQDKGTVTLYAQWTAAVYTITYDLADGSLADGQNNPATYTIESADFTLNNPTRKGFTFSGWTGTDLTEATTTVTVKTGSTGNRSYTATWTKSGWIPDDEDAPQFALHQLILSGQLNMMFYVYIPDAYSPEDCTVDFSVSGDTSVNEQGQKYAETITQNSYTLYGYNCYFSSVQMADKITATLNYGDGQTVQHTYTAVTYLDDIMSDETISEDTRELAASIKDYGSYVQPVLADYNGWTIGVKHAKIEAANDFDSTDFNTVSNDTASDAISYTIPDDSGIEKVNYTLVLDAATTLEVCLTPKSDYTGSVSVSVDGKSTEASLESGKYVARVSNISAHRLADKHTFTVVTGDVSFNVEVSAMSYVQSAIHDSDQAMKRAVTAIYRYWDANMTYRNNRPDEYKD